MSRHRWATCSALFLIFNFTYSQTNMGLPTSLSFLRTGAGDQTLDV
jgi:hypothetical protein